MDTDTYDSLGFELADLRSSNMGWLLYLPQIDVVECVRVAESRWAEEAVAGLLGRYGWNRTHTSLHGTRTDTHFSRAATPVAEDVELRLPAVRGQGPGRVMLARGPYLPGLPVRFPRSALNHGCAYAVVRHATAHGALIELPDNAELDAPDAADAGRRLHYVPREALGRFR